jgi:hypothetical protein
MRLENLALTRPFGLILLGEIGFDIDSKCQDRKLFRLFIHVLDSKRKCRL